MAVKTWTSERVTSADINTYLTNSGLVYVTSQTFSAVASVSFNNCFTSTYDNYYIQCSVIGSVAGNAYTLRYRAGGTDATSADYSIWGFYWNTSAVNLTTTGATSVFISNRSTSVYDVTNIYVFGPAQSRTTGHQIDAIELNTGLLIKTAGRFGLTSAFDGCTIAAASGTITGTISVYGYRKP